VAHLVIAKSENKTSFDGKNNTRRIINLVNNTITVIDKTTNQTVSTMPFTPFMKNTTNNETQNNLTFSANTANATTGVNLTEKFNALTK
jgi:hypothetical protein